MTLLLILLSFLFGYVLCKKTAKATKKPSAKKGCEVFSLREFLSYDGTEQTN